MPLLTDQSQMRRKRHQTHRDARQELLLSVGALQLPGVPPAVIGRLLVRSPAALHLAAPGPLVDDVEQVERALVLAVGALVLAPLVAVLAGGVVLPARLDAGAQALHDGVLQLGDRGAPGGGGGPHYRGSATDPTGGQNPQSHPQHGHEGPGGGLSGGRLSHNPKKFQNPQLVSWTNNNNKKFKYLYKHTKSTEICGN